MAIFWKQWLVNIPSPFGTWTIWIWNAFDPAKVLNVNKVKEILSQKPDDITDEEVLQWLEDRGYKIEWMDKAEQSFNQIQQKQQPIKQDKWFVERLGTDIKERIWEIWEAWEWLWEWKQDPVSTAWQTISNVVWWVGDVIWEWIISWYKSIPENQRQYINEQAMNVANTSLWQQWLKLIKEWWDKWEQFRANNPTIARDVEWIFNIWSMFIPWWKQATSFTVNAPWKIWAKISNLTKNILAKTSWLDKWTIDNIIWDVQWFLKAQTGETNVLDIKSKLMDWLDEAEKQLWDINKNYKSIIQTTTDKFDIKDTVDKFWQLLRERNVNIKKWKLDFSGKTSISDITDQNTLQRALNEINKFSKTENSVWELLNLRKSLDNMIDYRNPVSDTVQSVIKSARQMIDNKVKMIPWFKELDTQYIEQLNLIKWLKKDLFTAGQEKTNILSVIRNLTNKGNEWRLARMEEILPWIGKNIESLKSVADIENINKVWTYTASLLWAWWIAYATSNPLYLWLAILSIPWITPTLITNYAKMKNFVKWLGTEALNKITRKSTQIQETLEETINNLKSKKNK